MDIDCGHCVRLVAKRDLFTLLLVEDRQGSLVKPSCEVSWSGWVARLCGVGRGVVFEVENNLTKRAIHRSAFLPRLVVVEQGPEQGLGVVGAPTPDVSHRRVA